MAVTIGTVPSTPTHSGTNYIQNATISEKYSTSMFYALGSAAAVAATGATAATTGKGSWYGTQTFADSATCYITEQTHNYGVNAPDTTAVGWVVIPT